MSQTEFTRHRTGLDNRRLTDTEVAADVTQPPAPGEESAGPGMFDLVRETRHAQQVAAVLMQEASQMLKRRTVVEKTTAVTDGAGNLDMVLYQVPMGFEIVVTRINLEAIGFSPAVPFTFATGWVALVAGARFGVGSMIDFLPNPPAASGAILPATLTDGANQAGIFRGGEIISLHVNAGPITTAIYARLQGIQRAV